LKVSERVSTCEERIVMPGQPARTMGGVQGRRRRQKSPRSEERHASRGAIPAPFPRRLADTACETLVAETLVVVADARKRRWAEERRAFETADIWYLHDAHRWEKSRQG